MPFVAHPESRYAPFVGRAAPRAAQGGFAFMVVLVGLVLGSLSFYLENLNQAVSPTLQADKTRQALAEAKDILISWAAESEIDNNGPGHLPCPDNDNNGHGDGAACGPESRLGRFPWKTLNAPDLRDASGERLWYAVSPNFLNKATNPVNSDTKGVFRITGATEIDEVIAVIFAPGPALPGQNRSTDDARKNRANYLEDSNFADDVFVSSFDDEETNDRMIFITPADLYPAVERKVAERMQKRIVPVLHHYLQEWVDANNNAGKNTAPAKQLPFAAPFNPELASDRCGQNGQNSLSQGQLPLGGSDCFTWQSVNWEKQSGTCEITNAPSGSMTALRCTVVIKGSSDDDDDDECDDDDDEFVNRSVHFNVRLAGAGHRTFAMPLDKSRIDHTGQAPLRSFEVESARLNDGDIEFRYLGEYRINSCAPKTSRTAIILLPVYRFDNQYMYTKGAEIDALVDARTDLSTTAKNDLKDLLKDQVDPAWFFRNGWHRLSYYAASSVRAPCTGCPESLSLTRAQSTSAHDALLVLAGRATAYMDEHEQRKIQSRPSSELANYFESSNRDSTSPTYQQASLLKGVNDRIVSICPWAPNPYRPEDVQACP